MQRYKDPIVAVLSPDLQNVNAITGVLKSRCLVHLISWLLLYGYYGYYVMQLICSFAFFPPQLSYLVGTAIFLRMQ